MSGSRSYYTMVSLLVLLCMAYVLVVYFAPEEPDWEDSFSRADKIPFGAWVLYEQLDDLFPEGDIREVKQSVFDQLYYAQHWSPSDSIKTNYLFINRQFMPDEEEVEELLFFTQTGNQVFIAARRFSQELSDTLGIETDFDLMGMINDSTRAAYGHPQLQDVRGRTFNRGRMFDAFSSWDSSRTQVLATNTDGNPILLRIPFGDGAFVLSSTPNLFTNYHLLHANNHEFVAAALSHLPRQNRLWWDEYYKLRYQAQRQLSRSPLQYIRSQESLWWAWLIILWSLLLYVLFQIKRTQRIIPVVDPLPNQTLQFTETIGRLYFQRKDHKNLADKKIKQFLAQLRAHYFLKTDVFSDEFMASLAAKSGAEDAHVIQLCQLISRLQARKYVSESELLTLSEAIETFYEQSGHRSRQT